MKNNNRIETLGLSATLGPYLKFNSSSRICMLTSHKSQVITPEETDVPRSMTGFESQLGDHVFNIVMPTDGIVESIHYKYRPGLGKDSINGNPITTIVYRCHVTGHYDSIDVYEYHTTHKVFGTKFVIQPIVGKLRPGVAIPKGTILAANPNVKAGGIYASGVETSMAYMSKPCTIEDGVGVTECYLKRIRPLEITKYVCSWGRQSYPLNVHGDADNYKPFLDIGDVVPESGLLFATREYDSTFDAFDMTPKALMRVDMIHDQRIYGTPGATIYDITVESGIAESRTKKRTPENMCSMVNKYINNATLYYNSLLATYDSIIAKDRNAVLNPRLMNLVVRAIADRPNAHAAKTKSRENGIIRRTHKRVPLDEYRVEIKCTTRIPVGLGTKLTGSHGNKAVICDIIADADAPIDKDGNVVDLVTYSKGAVSRLNVGQFYEQYINAASRDMTKHVRANYGKLSNDELFASLMNYYSVVAKDQYNEMLEHYTSSDLIDSHVKSVVDAGIYLYIDPTDDNINKDLLKKVEQVISPTYGPLTYVDNVGRRVTTKDSIFVGPADMIVLEKTDQNPTSISSGSLQHHGLLSGPSKTSRLAHPSKTNSIRVLGETECRLYAATMGSSTVAELLDNANNPTSHRAAIKSILSAKKPSYIKELIDRKKLPLGGSRSLSFVNHIFAAMGYSITEE